jgi:hypothetical protein
MLHGGRGDESGCTSGRYRSVLSVDVANRTVPAPRELLSERDSSTPVPVPLHVSLTEFDRTTLPTFTSQNMNRRRAGVSLPCVQPQRVRLLMTTVIWIEPVKRPDGSKRYTDRGLLLRTRLGGPDGEIICDGVHNAVCETCRVLISRAITGPFETWREGIPYACLRGDIERTASLSVEEGSTKSSRFRRWEPHPHSQDALSRARGSAPAREGDVAGRGW